MKITLFVLLALFLCYTMPIVVLGLLLYGTIYANFLDRTEQKSQEQSKEEKELSTDCDETIFWWMIFMMMAPNANGGLKSRKIMK
jgi:hypothetical protein